MCLVGGTAWASDFGCPAEWLSVFVFMLSFPVGLASLLLCAWRSEVWFGVAAGGLLTSLVVLGAVCDRGQDRDGLALAMVAAVVLLTFGVAVSRWAWTSARTVRE